MVRVIYRTFLDTVGAAIAIETRGTYSARPRDFSCPSQGPSKKSASGSSAGSGSSGESGYDPQSRNRGHFKRPSKSQLGRQQTDQFSAGGSSQGGSSGGQNFLFGQQQSSGCFECGGHDHFWRDCHLLAQGTVPTQPGGQSLARGSSGGSHGGSAARGGSQQGSGQRGCSMTHVRLHAMTQQEGRTFPYVIIGTLLIFGEPAFTLIDPGATHSFMSSRFTLHVNVSSSSLLGKWHVSLPYGEVMRID
ncbi:hypothetical protein ACLB2K_039766 [Fragaria x ananassa]